MKIIIVSFSRWPSILFELRFIEKIQLYIFCRFFSKSYRRYYARKKKTFCFIYRKEIQFGVVWTDWLWEKIYYTILTFRRIFFCVLWKSGKVDWLLVKLSQDRNILAEIIFARGFFFCGHSSSRHWDPFAKFAKDSDIKVILSDKTKVGQNLSQTKLIIYHFQKICSLKSDQ